MNETITLKRITAKSLFKLVLIGEAMVIIPFAILCGVFSFFGLSFVSWNSQPLTGTKGLIASPFIGIFLTLVWTSVIWVGLALGGWLYSKIFRKLKIDYIPF